MALQSNLIKQIVKTKKTFSPSRMKILEIVVLISFIVAKKIYKLKRLFREPDTLEFLEERNIEDRTYRFWLGKELDVCDAPSLPEMTNILIDCPTLKLTKNNKTYEIVPCKSIKMSSATETVLLGTFSDIKYVDKNIVCTYTNGDYCDGRRRYSAKIVYSKGKGVATLEKYFSGVPSEHVFKVSGDFLCNKKECLVFYYAVIDKNGVVKEAGDEKVDVIEELRKLEKFKVGSISPNLLDELKYFKDKVDLKKETESGDYHTREIEDAL